MQCWLRFVPDEFPVNESDALRASRNPIGMIEDSANRPVKRVDLVDLQMASELVYTPPAISLQLLHRLCSQYRMQPAHESV